MACSLVEAEELGRVFAEIRAMAAGAGPVISRSARIAVRTAALPSNRVTSLGRWARPARRGPLTSALAEADRVAAHKATNEDVWACLGLRIWLCAERRHAMPQPREVQPSLATSARSRGNVGDLGRPKTRRRPSARPHGQPADVPPYCSAL